MANIKEAAKSVMKKDGKMHPYLIGFNDGDETELDAKNIDELEELWNSLCPEFGCELDSVDYVEVGEE